MRSCASRPPFLLVAQHGVQCCQQLAHDRDNGDLGRLAGSQQTLLERLQDRIAHRRGLRCHEQDAADRSATVSRQAAKSLAAARDVPGLIAALEHDDEEVSKTADEALKKARGK